MGYYQPDLTDCLIDNNSRRGRFVEKSFIKKTYFEYWYANNDLIKIKYITDDYYDNYDVIIEKKIILPYICSILLTIMGR